MRQRQRQGLKLVRLERLLDLVIFPGNSEKDIWKDPQMEAEEFIGAFLRLFSQCE